MTVAARSAVAAAHLCVVARCRPPWRCQRAPRPGSAPAGPAGPDCRPRGPAFVRSLKRDYVQVTPLPGAASILGLLPAWFEDYNTCHPHSGLKKRWPC